MSYHAAHLAFFSQELMEEGPSPNLCKHFLVGFCRFEGKCKFSHGEAQTVQGCQGEVPQCSEVQEFDSEPQVPKNTSSFRMNPKAKEFVSEPQCPEVQEFGSEPYGPKCRSKRPRHWVNFFLVEEFKGHREVSLIPMIIGTKGAHTVPIAAQTGAKLRIRGIGSGHIEENGMEARVPLMLSITHDRSETAAFVEAVNRALIVLKMCQVNLEQWCKRTNRTAPHRFFYLGEASMTSHKALGDIMHLYPNPNPALGWKKQIRWTSQQTLTVSAADQEKLWAMAAAPRPYAARNYAGAVLPSAAASSSSSSSSQRR